jgi:hypothetical protein
LELIFNPIRHHLSHHPCDRQKSYQSHFIGSIARSDLWGIKWLEAYPTFSRVDCEAKPLHEPYGKIHYRGLDPKKRAPPTDGAQTEGKRVTSSSAS